MGGTVNTDAEREASIAVLGAGSWGTALAIQFARGGRPTRLWGRNPDLLRDIARERRNTRYLPGAGFPEALTVAADLNGALGGAVKNVLAVGAGLADGLGFGANTRIALITRGLVEMTRLGVTLGAQRETFMGLAGLGDLVLTCTDDQSRNRRFGLLLAGGRTPEQALAEIGQSVEGYLAAKAVTAVARRAGVDMPISTEIYSVLYENRPARDVVRGLMSRPIKAETQ